MSSAFGYGVDLINQPQGGGGGNVMVLISDTVLSSDQASVSITSIPATSKHLMLVVSCRSSGAGSNDTVSFRFNNDSGNNYDSELIYTSSAGTNHAEETAVSDGRMITCPAAASTRPSSGGTNVGHVLDYAGTSFEKTMVVTGGDATTLVGTATNFWHSTASINRIDVFVDGGNLKAGSRVTLYGF